MAAGIKRMSKTIVWIILGLLILGLAGFGATSFTGSISKIGQAGGQPITIDAYARELQREIRAVEAQTGQSLQMTQARELGLDRIVLARLVALASLDNEVSEMGVSVGDANLQKEIISIPAFQGTDGSFDREAYRFALGNAGISETEFEQDLRSEAGRTLVQGAIMDGIRMPASLSDAIITYLGARRNFSWARIDRNALATPLPEPTQADLQALYDADPARFMLPRTRQITYAMLTPEMILDSIDIDEASLRKLYSDRDAEFNLPERRLVERLVFSDDAAASAAMAQIEVGGATFPALVAERGLAMGDVDMGDVTRADLGTAGDGVFSAEEGQVVGPLPTPLGPALFRINGTLAARSTPFEQVEEELRDELASDRARRVIEGQAQDYEDLLAGGATLEDLVKETEMQLGQIDWTPDATGGPAAYDAFRTAAEAVSDADFPTITYLEDGGVFALRLDGEVAPRPEPFETAGPRVAAEWAAEQLRAALMDRANGAIATMATEGEFDMTGLTIVRESALTRSAFIEGTPAGFMKQVFEMEPGETRTIPADDAVYLVRFDEALPPEPSPQLDAIRTAIADELNQSLSQAVFDAYVRDAQIRARPQIDEQALAAVQASFQ